MAGHSNPLTPLRYPGGKGAFAPFVRSIIEANHLIGGHYMEPFAGGCAVALDLLFNGHAEVIHINDLDAAIYHFWLSVVQQPQAFLERLNDTPITIDEWYCQKSILDNPQNHTDLEHGFAAFFLNRTNRSGILKAGVIGGKSQSGVYKLDARFNKDKLVKRIERIAAHANRIKVYNLDAVELLQQAAQILPQRSLIYLDPPYYIKGQGLYRNFYKHQDHVDISLALAKLKHPWIVSYDNCQKIKDIYKNYRQHEYALDYCAYKKLKGAEVMIYSPNTHVPEQHLLKTA